MLVCNVLQSTCLTSGGIENDIRPTISSKWKTRGGAPITLQNFLSALCAERLRRNGDRRSLDSKPAPAFHLGQCHSLKCWLMINNYQRPEREGDREPRATTKPFITITAFLHRLTILYLHQYITLRIRALIACLSLCPCLLFEYHP